MKSRIQIITEHTNRFANSLSRDMFTQNLIIGIMKEYGTEILDMIIKKTYIADDNHNPVITQQELINIKEELK